MDIIRQHHLETTEGRTTFLTDKLIPYTATADQLNSEVQALATEIEVLSPEEDQQQILALTEELTQKMAQLLAMLPILNTALSVNQDLQQIDPILQQTDPISPEQQEVIDRIASLCTSLENF